MKQLKIALCVFLLGGFLHMLLGQTVATSVTGVVTDASGAVIPHAQAVLQNTDQQNQQTAATNAAGVYVFTSVSPGRYSLSIAAPGFKTYNVTALQVLVDQPVTIDASLIIGAASQSVDVISQGDLLNREDATLGTVIQSREITALPLSGRQFTQLILLAPGVAPIESSQQSGNTISIGSGGISPAVNGMRPQMNNFTIDGVENNMRFTNTYAISPPPDAIQEFNVETHQTDPAAALAAGANVNLVSRSGTNALHGAIWEFLRNNDLAANGYFNNLYNEKALPYAQNQFGFTLGGPFVIPKMVSAKKSHTYFFGYYEGLKYRRSAATVATVPTDAERNGNLFPLLGEIIGTDANGQPVYQGEIYDPTHTIPCSSCAGGYIRPSFSNNTIPTGQINPIATAYINALYPEPNTTGAINNLVLAQKTLQNSNQFGIRVDHDFAGGKRLYGRVSWQNSSQNNPGSLPANGTVLANSAINGVAHYTWAFTPSFLADFSFGVNRAVVTNKSTPFDAAFAGSVGSIAVKIQNGYLPADEVLTSSAFTSTSYYEYDLADPDTSYQYNADLKKVVSTHDISFGFRLLHWRHESGNQGNTTLTYSVSTTDQPGFSSSGQSFASFLLGYPTSSNYQYSDPLQTYGNIYVGYAGDSWKITRKLTIAYGLQYVYAAPPLVKDNRISAFDYQTALNQPNATDFAFAYVWAGQNPVTGAGPNAKRNSIVNPDRNNFAPRLSIAYSATEKSVFRAGFGTFYDYNTNLIQNSIRVAGFSWPYGLGQQVSGQNATLLGPESPVISLSNPFITATATPPVPRNTLNPFNRDPYVLQWNAGIEQSLPWSMALSIDYVGSGGRKLVLTEQQNIAPVGIGNISARSPLHNAGPFFSVENAGSSAYNALQTKVEKQFSNGLSFLNSYTWSKSLDVQSDPNTADLDYVYDIRLSRGPSDFNLPQIEVFSMTYQLPFGRGQRYGGSSSFLMNTLLGGWETAGSFQAHSGLPYFISSGTDNENTGNFQSGFTERANEVSSPRPPRFRQTQAEWFDKAAFAVPAFGTMGNTSRNEFRGPDSQVINAMFGKRFAFTDQTGIEFRSEFFNLLNRTNFHNPVSNVLNSSNGLIYSASSARDIQLALKLFW